MTSSSIFDTFDDWAHRISRALNITDSIHLHDDDDDDEYSNSSKYSQAQTAHRQQHSSVRTLRQRLCTEHIDTSLQALKKPRSVRLASRLNCSNQHSLWPLNNVLGLQGQTVKHLMAPLLREPLIGLTEISRFATDVTTSNQDVLAFASGEALLCFNPLSRNGGGAAAVPDGVELSTRLQSVIEPATFLEIDFSSCVWACPWAHASYLQAGKKCAWSVFASMPLTDHFVRGRDVEPILPHIHSDLLSEEAIVGARLGTSSLDMGVQLHVINGMLGVWALKQIQNMRAGIQCRVLPIDRKLSQFDMSAYYQMTPHTELGLEVTQLAQQAQASVVHNICTESWRINNHQIIDQNGLDIGVQILADNLRIKNKFEINTGVALSWRTGSQIGVTLYVASDCRAGIRVSKRLPSRSNDSQSMHSVCATFMHSWQTHSSNVSVSIDS